MRTNLLVFATLLVSAMASAQFTVWEDDFNDGDLSDWTLLDLDGNTSKWRASGNLQVTENIVPYFGTEYAVLSTYNINLTNGEILPNPENNWAISPAIDLSYYMGTTKLIINAQTAIYDGDEDLFVYASTSPDQESFVLVGTKTIVRLESGSTNVQFNEYTVDITNYVGQPQVYFALKTSLYSFIGYEINNIYITAQDVLGIQETAGKTATVLKQNPVTEKLEFQLGSTIHTDTLMLKLYSINGMLIKEVKYEESGVAVGDLSAGMYLAVLSDGLATEQLKFIKK